jgi:hypothetical protein
MLASIESRNLSVDRRDSLGVYKSIRARKSIQAEAHSANDWDDSERSRMTLSTCESQFDSTMPLLELKLMRCH